MAQHRPPKAPRVLVAEDNPALRSSRFVVITSFPEDATERRIRELDAKLLAKPFSLGEFRSLMKTVLSPATPTTGGEA
jgi:hypothetical protein